MTDADNADSLNLREKVNKKCTMETPTNSPTLEYDRQGLL